MEMIAKFKNKQWVLVAMVNNKREEFVADTLAEACQLYARVQGGAA